MAGDIHRIGGGTVDNLRLKPAEQALDPPGISVLQAPTPADAAWQMRAAFPRSLVMRALASTVGTTTGDLIRSVGFNLMPNPTAKFPNHYRIIHTEGAVGFSEENLEKLARVFSNTTGH